MSKFLLILLFLVYSSPMNAAPPSSPGTNPEEQYSGLRLVLSWPPSVCRVQGCVTKFDYFTVHGLYPENKSFKQNAYVAKAQINRLRKDLSIVWPDLKKNGAYDFHFYVYRWSYNGVYCSTQFTPQKYFKLGINLGRKYSKDLSNALEAAGIIPREDGYDPMQIARAIEAGLQHEPEINCQKMEQAGHGDKYYLTEVHLCFDKHGTNLVDCERTKILCYKSAEIFFIPRPEG